MADQGSYDLGPHLDIQQLFIEAQHRWLRPAEICEILRNYQNFHISPEPPDRPSSGSLYLFDRKVLRYFRKDGHNWRKKKDGKTVKEAHEKLKVGSVDVLHCYYAHGEENENFQRRSYWMLEQELMHIVFVHYLEVKQGNRSNASPSNSFTANHNTEPSGNADSNSPSSALSSTCEDVDSADSHQMNSEYYKFPGSPQVHGGTAMDKVNVSQLNSQVLYPGLGSVLNANGDVAANSDNAIHNIASQSLESWEEVLQQCTPGYNNLPSQASTNSDQLGTTRIGGNMDVGEILAPGTGAKQGSDGSFPIQPNWQIPLQNSSFTLPAGLMDPILASNLTYGFDPDSFEQKTHIANVADALGTFFDSSVQQNEQLLQNNLHMQLRNEEPCVIHSYSESDASLEGNNKYSLGCKQTLLNGEEGLKKVDSFSRWITRELGEVDDLHMRSSTGISWSTDENGNIVDDSSLSPSLSQDQLFSIVDFSPKWAYSDSKTEVHVIGTFLVRQQDVAKCKWSCMFGEVEVPAEVLTDEILCCYAPPHCVARVPFYVTCSNRLACSELREFDYHLGSAEDLAIVDIYHGCPNEIHLYMQFERLLTLRPSCPPSDAFDGARERKTLVSKIMLLKEEDESYQITELISEKVLTQDEVRKQIFQKLMKERFYSWLLHRATESGKGPSVLGNDGQGMLHLAAALGCDWAIRPTVTAGVSINFRDVNGWTALHWAAFYGREQMVIVLISLGAATGALTDPSPEFPLGRTPADLASANGHKGISGFLAESSLTSYLESLTVKDPKEDRAPEVSGTKAVQTVSERTATPVNDGDMHELSLKDSLTAIRNATQAADRIYQVFRMQSFQRKQLTDYGDEELGILDKFALSLVATKARKPLHLDGVAHAAAVQIQKKFRGWKKRKEFLTIRERVVKIQAHVRGHQVRKQYKSFVWSVGIVEKVILRWRRKGSGLRGFRNDALTKESNPRCLPSKDDDYDFLKEGRKQNEQRTQKALSRVVSMFHNPEGRAQYRRLLTVAEKFRETEASDMALSNPEGTVDGEQALVGFDSLLDDDAFMSIAFE
uniref:CG-1 domain-containing protein n=1 Tax=Rhizophora mucronata TaxID=61149 RepID=A0A2P2MIR2_RHIMU